MSEENLHNTTSSPPALKLNPSPLVDSCLDQLRLLRLKDVLQLIPVARSTWLGWVAAGIAPVPVRIGRTTAWRYHDLVALIEQATARGGG